MTIAATPFSIMQRFVGVVRELPGAEHHPLIQFGFVLCGMDTDTPDEVAWCSAGLQVPFWILRLARSKSAAARSWLEIGHEVVAPAAEHAAPGFDVVVLRRGPPPQPGPEVTRGAPGHVGLFAGFRGPDRVLVLGGNQGNAVSVAAFPVTDVLGYRRVDS